MLDIKKIVGSSYPYVIFGLLLLYGYFSEKIPVHQGLGFHASEIADRVADLSGLFRGEYSPNWLRHMLPTALLHYVFKLFSYQPAAREIVLSCTALNCACIFGMLLLWKRICKTLKINGLGEATGAIALSVNGMVKFLMFYPSMVYDGPSYFLGMLALHLWLARKQIFLFLVIVVSTGIHETVTLSALILFLFPPRDVAGEESAKKTFAPAFSATALSLFAVVYGFVMYNIDISYFRSLNYTAIKSNDIILLSIFVAVSYLSTSLYAIMTNVTLSARPFTQIFAVKLVVVVPMLYLLGKIIFHFSSQEINPLSLFPANIFYYIGNATYDAPGYFLVVKLVSFGPLVVLAALFWKDFVTTVMKFGAGITLCLFFAIFRVLETESRHFLEIFPILLPFIILACQHRLNTNRLLYFFFVSVIFSKLWAPLSSNFPEYYFWGFGSFFSSFQGYVIQLVATLFCFLFTFIAFQNSDVDRITSGN